MHKQILFVHHVAVVDDKLGPGRRLAVWTTGCPFRCVDCIEENLQQLEIGKAFQVDVFFHQIKPYLNSLQAVTFSGGEPLFQKESMKMLLQMIKQRPDIDIMLYTGMETNHFLKKYKEFHPLIDICITEPFIHQQHGSYLWRGSTNQKILSPSGKYAKETLEEWMHLPSCGIDVHFEQEHCYTYGIPVPGYLDYLDEILNKKGITIN